MKSTVTKLETNRVLVEIEVDEKQVDRALDQAYRKVVKQVSIPGFRKGKVPRWILESRFGPEVLYEDALEILMPEAYSQAVKDNDLDPIAQPSVEVVQFESGKPFIFKAEVEVTPEVKLGEYKGLSAVKRIPAITEEDVESVLREYQERMAELVTVEKDAVENGDFVSVDFEGFIDGEPFSGGAAKNQILEVGSGTFIPGFEEGLIGAPVGEETEITVTFPEDYHESLAGKEAVFKVTVKEIKEKHLPAIDDEFAKDVSNCETLEELRQEIRERLGSAVEEEAVNHTKEELVGKAVDNAQVEIPKTLIDRGVESLIHNLNHELSYRGMDLEQYLDIVGKTREELEEELRPRAERQVKRDLVLDAIVNEEGIVASEEEIDKEIQAIAKARGAGAEKAIEELNKEARRSAIADQIKISKAVNLLYDNAEVKEEIVERRDKEEASEAQSE